MGWLIGGAICLLISLGTFGLAGAISMDRKATGFGICFAAYCVWVALFLLLLAVLSFEAAWRAYA